MEIVTPLTGIEELDILLENGADEFYLGYIPYEWLDKYFNYLPLNGRERMYANFSIHSSKNMKILAKTNIANKIYVTFNGHYYNEEAFELVLKIIEFLYDLNLKKYIVADLNLVIKLREKYDDIKIAISGDMGLFNSLAIKYVAQYNVDRIIFPRKTPIAEMKQIIKATESYNLEYEAFVLNELCFYSGAFCNAYHCDELLRICRLPRVLVDVSGEYIRKENFEKRISNLSSNTDLSEYELGMSGCGLCKIRELNDVGVTHLKLVGRGKAINFLIEDLKTLRNLISISQIKTEEQEYEDYVLKDIFHGKCPKDCYYVDK